MKPALEHLPLNPGESFVAKSFDYPYYPTPWHFHPEYEIVLITKSSGKRFIGDSISNFKQGNLAFLGPRLPHLYRNDPLYYAPKSGLRAKSVVIHFLESSFGDNFLSLPETKKLQSLFHKSRKGLDITGKTAKIVSEALVELLSMQGLSRWLKLLEILNIISESKDCKYISGSVISGYNSNDSERLNTVFEFVIKNYHRDIQISEVAKMINMAENSFSRYFSQRTRKTFTTFVNELRLSNACKLLIENKLSISQICFECGYNNLSNFNRQFRHAYNNNPSNHKKQYLMKYDK